MQTFGSGFNIVIGTSSSLATGSISTGSFLQGINFIYVDPRYTSSYYSGSIVSIEPVISEVTKDGAVGYLTFKLPDIADTKNVTKKEAVRFFISGGEARLGIGFDTDKGDEPQFPLDIKSTKDTGEGTKFVLRHARPTKGAETGDTAGKILFTIDSGSFKNIEDSGSVGSIESDVLEVDETGVTGDIIVKTSYVKNEAPTEVFRVNRLNSNFSSSLRVQGNQLTVDNTVVATYGRMDSLRIGPAAVSPGDDNAYIHGNLNVSTSFTASGLNYPDVDGLDRQVIKTDGNGNLSFGYPEATTIAVKNVSGGSIPKGTPCYITASGTSGNTAGIIPADASNPNLMPAGIIAGETLADEAEGIGLVNGFIQGVDTSTFASGDTVYVAVGGGYTNVKPTGSGVLIQKLGNVEKSDVNGSGVINGPGYYNELPNWETYEFGYEITTAFPVTGSGLIVSSSYLPSNHYNMVKIGETELIDLNNSALTSNTFFIHNVDNFVVASGSEPVNIYGDGPAKLFEHTGDEFKVYAKDELKVTIDSGSTTTSNLLIASGRISAKATEDTDLQYVAGFTSSPTAAPKELIFVTASTFGGGGSSSTPYSLGTFGGSYNWGTADGGERVAHGYVNGPNAGQTQNSTEWGASIVGTPDSTTHSMSTYLMQYHAIYCPVGGIPHIKAWGRTSDSDFTSAHSMSISLWSLETEPTNLTGGSQTITLRAQSDFLPFNASTINYQGNGWIASGSSARPEGTFYFVTFDLGGPNPASTAILYANFTIWIEPS